MYLDNARYHHTKMLRPFLKRLESRVQFHFPPPYAPHLNPIGRLWGVIHSQVKHNRFQKGLRQTTGKIRAFLSDTLPRSWKGVAKTITDSFRTNTHDRYRSIR